MLKRFSRAASACAVAAGLVAGLMASSPAQAAEIPPLNTPIADLQAAVSCDANVTPTSGKKVVLLVHGTGGAVAGYWDWNYMRALPAAGFGVCTVTLPSRALVDPIISAEYVVHAARTAYAKTGNKKISMVGHSQGGSLAVWAVKFWSDVAGMTDDVIGLAGAMQGVGAANVLCVASCAAVAHRASFNSKFMTALGKAPMPSGVSFTSVSSLTDDIVAPQPLAGTLPGAKNVAIQGICPIRIFNHAGMLSDAVAYQLVLDALKNAGTADPARIGNRLSLCLTANLPGTVLPSPEVLQTLAAGLALLGGSEPKISAEPALPTYAAAYGS